jgi:hypothetical protein
MFIASRTSSSGEVSVGAAEGRPSAIKHRSVADTSQGDLSRDHERNIRFRARNHQKQTGS